MVWIIGTLIAWFTIALAAFSAAIVSLVRLRNREQAKFGGQYGQDRTFSTCTHCGGIDGLMHDVACPVLAEVEK